MGVRFLHLSDLHLGSRHEHLGDFGEERGREVLETFRQAIEFALDPSNRIDCLLVCGNLFDHHRPDGETWAFVRGLLSRLVGARKPMVMIPGTRDSYAYKDSVFRTERWPGVDLITAPCPSPPRRREIAGVPVFFYGVAAQPGLSPPVFPGFERIAEEGLHIGLLNAALRDHPEWNSRPHDQAVEAASLQRSGLDYFALGGYHGFTPLRLGQTTAAYAGTLEGRRFAPGDYGCKSLTVAEVEPGSVSLENYPISRRVVAEWRIDLQEERILDPEGLSAALISRASPEIIARVVLSGTHEFLCDLDELRCRLADRFAFLEILDQTDLLQSNLLARIEAENTIRGHFVRRTKRRIAELTARAQTAAAEAAVHRDLQVARMSLRLGLEHFLEEEPVPALLPAPPSPAGRRTRPAPGSAPAVAASRVGNNGGMAVPVGRERTLLRAELESDRKLAGETEEEGS